MHEIGDRRAAITGVGQSEIGRPLDRSSLHLTIQAALLAIDDAGLTPQDIDGLSTFPGRVADPPGYSPVGTVAVKEALRLRLNWYCGGGETPSQLGAVINACAAVAGGLADHVLVFRTIGEASAQHRLRQQPASAPQHDRISDRWFPWLIPFHAYSPANWLAMIAQRHFYEFGTTKEQLAQIPLVQRRHAQRNPDALFHDPMTMNDYLGARTISTPFGLYDCDMPVDGSAALIVSSRSAAQHLAKRPIMIESVGCALHERSSWDQTDNLCRMAAHDAADMLWSRTDLTPADVHVAQLYDGFSFLVMIWLEALGFCGPGESGAFVNGGHRISLDGQLPLNTGGGQLSAGRLHGYGHILEACRQLWGECGDRNVTRPPETAVVSAGGGPHGGCMLLRRL